MTILMVILVALLAVASPVIIFIGFPYANKARSDH